MENVMNPETLDTTALETLDTTALDNLNPATGEVAPVDNTPSVDFEGLYKTEKKKNVVFFISGSVIGVIGTILWIKQTGPALKKLRADRKAAKEAKKAKKAAEKAAKKAEREVVNA